MLVPPLVTAEWEDVLGGSGWLDTLLGPEETDLWDCDRIPVTRAKAAPSRVSPLAPGRRDGASAVVGVRCGGRSRGLWDLMQDHPLAIPARPKAGCSVAWWGGCCLLFEICIVDASIFVAKFFRAHGGCLGIRSR